MTTPTNNSIPSNNLLDARFNFEKLDQIVNSDSSYYIDRFGKQRLTAKGLQGLVENIDSEFELTLGEDTTQLLMGRVENADRLREISGAPGRKIDLARVYPGDSRSGGTLLWVDDSVSPDDGVVFFRVNDRGGWIRENWRNGILAEWAGDLIEISDASDRLNKISLALKTFNSEVLLPSGNIYVGKTWKLSTSQLKITGAGSSTWIIGKPSDADGLPNNDPVMAISADIWDSVTVNGQGRTQDIDIRDFCISGRNYPLNPTSQNYGISSRDGIFLGGCGWDFQLQRIWFYNLGRRAVVSEDLWDGDFLDCKFHEIGVDKTFTSSDGKHQAMVFKRKVDSCNAIRITNCHFEHCYRGAINIADLCYFFNLTNNKFEAQNQNADFPIETPIYVGNNHRGFVWTGGMAVVSQQAKYKHYARIFGDSTVIRDVEFRYPNNTDGAAILDLSYGNYAIGATIDIRADVRGDIVDAQSNPVYPIISRTGGNNFGQSIIKCYNPGRIFQLLSTSNPDDLSGVRVIGLGADTGQTVVYQSQPINRVNGLRWTGIPYTTLTNVTSKADTGEFAMLCNLSTTVTFNPGDRVASASLAASASDGTNIGAGQNIVGWWICMGYCPPGKVTLFKRVS